MDTQNLDVLLSDGFIEFSKQIEQIHISKKTLKTEFKKQYDAFQAKMLDFDNQAKKLVDDFEASRNNLTSKPPTTPIGTPGDA